MVEFDANLVYDDGENVIGWDVIVTSEAGDVIGSVAVTDQTTITGLQEELEEISESIVSIEDILALLANTNEDNTINATLLSGIASDGYAKTVHTHDDRYYTESEVNALLLNKAGVNHTHTASNISDFDTSFKTNFDTNLNWTLIYDAPLSSFDNNNINKSGTNSIQFWKCGNLILCKYYITTTQFGSSVLASDRNVIGTLPSKVQASTDFYETGFNASATGEPCLINVGNGFKIRPYKAIAYVTTGTITYVAKNNKLE